MDKRIVDDILDQMDAKAQELGVTGVSIFLAAPIKGGTRLTPHVSVLERIERPADRGVSDTGTNYFGVAFTKLAEMLSTAENSGWASRPTKVGETGYRGGLIFVDEEGSKCFAFSGGTEDQDVEIAKAGAAVLGLT